MGDYYSQNIRSTILLWVYIKTCSCFGSSGAGIASRLILVPDFNIVSKKCKTMEWTWSLAENDLAIRNMRTISHPQSADPEKSHTAENWNLHKYKNVQYSWLDDLKQTFCVLVRKKNLTNIILTALQIVECKWNYHSLKSLHCHFSVLQ